MSTERLPSPDASDIYAQLRAQNESISLARQLTARLAGEAITLAYELIDRWVEAAHTIIATVHLGAYATRDECNSLLATYCLDGPMLQALLDAFSCGKMQLAGIIDGHMRNSPDLQMLLRPDRFDYTVDTELLHGERIIRLTVASRASVPA